MLFIFRLTKLPPTHAFEFLSISHEYRTAENTNMSITFDDENFTTYLQHEPLMPLLEQMPAAASQNAAKVITTARRAIRDCR